MNLLIRYQYWIMAAIAVLILPFYISSTFCLFGEWLADGPPYQDLITKLMTRIDFQDNVYWFGWQSFIVVSVLMTAVAVTWELAHRK